MRGRSAMLLSGVIAGLVVLTGCPAKKPVASATPPTAPTKARTEPRSATPVPTVPPSTPAALPTRPIPNPNVKATKGKPIGPIITHFGAAKADGTLYQPESVDQNGVATYKSIVGSGFMLIIEAKPGLSNYEVARSIFSYDPNDPKKRPDLQLISNRPLGDGSELVCDRRPPEIGGVPAVSPPSFAETQKVSDALNDMACRFETFLDSSGACTLNKNGDFSFVNPESTAQFGMIVARAWNFPVGTTELRVRLRDVAGNVGPTKTVRIFRPASVERPKPKVTKPPAKPTPKPLPTR